MGCNLLTNIQLAYNFLVIGEKVWIPLEAERKSQLGGSFQVTHILHCDKCNWILLGICTESLSAANRLVNCPLPSFHGLSYSLCAVFVCVSVFYLSLSVCVCVYVFSICILVCVCVCVYLYVFLVLLLLSILHHNPFSVWNEHTHTRALSPWPCCRQSH